MGILEGSPRQKLLFAALIAVYALSVVVSTEDKLARIGEPDVGWIVDQRAFISPSRLDASELGLRGGGRALAVNGVEVDPDEFPQVWAKLTHWELGATNAIRLEQRGEQRELTIPVRSWTWQDALFVHGVIDVLALLFLGTALVSFALRPYEATSWAILTLAAVSGSLLTVVLLSPAAVRPWQEIYLRCLEGFLPAAILHAALAFPVVHPLLVRRSGGLLALYGFGGAHAALQLVAHESAWEPTLRFLPAVDASLPLAAIVFFTARCGVLAVRTRDPLVAQRARILLVGLLIGAGPPAAAAFLRNAAFTPTMDMRWAYWGMSLFFLPLGYISVRQSMMNAAAAVRRAVLYVAVAAALTGVALLLIAVQAYAIALLLFPLLYWWPNFDRRLTARIYPKRARLPELMRDLAANLASQTGVEGVLDVLAGAPIQLCDARSGVAFLFPDSAGAAEIVRATGGFPIDSDVSLSGETLVKLMGATRQEVFRTQVAVEPQYSNIEADCYAFFDRLDAEVLLPILRNGEVIGGLAAGARAAGDAYESPELFALATATQQAVQSLSRVEAIQRLRDRELEFSELKRFFPTQIIDQVMEKGGAAELRTRRKLVTVFFADLRDFTSFAEDVEPEEVMSTLAEYHETMGRCVAESAGTLERFAGDGFMVFFNDPVEQPDHVERAVSMALRMRAELARLRESWGRKGYAIDVGMGLHTGYATVGFIGYEGRRDYAVIGNVTNLAARLSDAAGGGQILISGAVRSELGPGYETESAGELQLKGFNRPQPALRLV